MAVSNSGTAIEARTRYPTPRRSCSSLASDHRSARRPSPPTSSATSASPASSCSCCRERAASRSRPRRRCCSPASTSHKGEYTLFAVDRRPACSATSSGSWIAYGVGYFGRIELLEKHGRKLHIKPSHLRVGRPLVRALRRRRRSSSRACCRSSARSSRCPPASRGCRSGASPCSRSLGCIPWVFLLTFIGKQAGRQLGRVEGPPPLRGLRRRRGDRRRASSTSSCAGGARRGAGRAGADAPPAERAPAAPRASRSARCTAPPSCCRSPPPATSRSCRGCCGWPYAELDAELRKAFEVALHAGTAAALLIALRDEVGEAARGLDRRRVDAARRCRSRRRRWSGSRSSARSSGGSARRRTIAAGPRSSGRVAMAARPTARRSARAREDAGLRRRAARSASRRRARSCRASRATARRSPPRGCARLHARGRQRALAPRRAAGDRSARPRSRARGCQPRRCRRGCASRSRLGAGAVVRLDARLDLADPPGRARPLAAPYAATASRSRRSSPAGRA